MEPERPRREYFYNPWVLSLLYARLLFWEQLLALHAHRGGGHAPPTVTDLARRGERAEAVLVEVRQLMQALAQQQFACDAVECNFEYALYRMAALARPPDVTFHADCADPGALYACECALGAELGTQQPSLLFEAVERYIAQHYAGTDLTHHGELSAQRLTLLLNAKQTMERKCLAPLSGGASDTVVCYNSALLMTMLHCTLLEQFRANLQCRARTGEAGLAPALHLMERLLAVAQRQYCDEFQGYAVQCYPHKERLDAQFQRLDNHNRQYALRRNPVPTVRQLEQQSEREWLFVECETGQHRYLRLDTHAHHYLHVARRFVFDCALRRLHGCGDCVQSPKHAPLPRTGGRYARGCQICRYMAQQSELTLLYTQCEQFHRCAHSGAESAQPHAFLASLLVRPLGTYGGWLYVCLDELQRQFSTSVFASRDDDDDGAAHSAERNLFRALDLLRLKEQVAREVGRQNMDERADAVLALCGRTRACDAQRGLALRLVLLQYIQQAVAEQQVEIESYERSLGALVCSEKMHLSVCAELARIYVAYRRVLSEWLVQTNYSGISCVFIE